MHRVVFRSAMFLFLTSAVFGANVIRYNDRSVFITDTSSRETVDFEDARQCAGISEMFNPVNLKGVSFTGGANRGTNRGACSPILSTFQNWVFNARLFGTTRDTTVLTVALPGNPTAVAFDVGVSDELATSWTVEVTLLTADAIEQAFDVAGTIVGTGTPGGRRTQPTFVGFTSSRPVTTLRYRIRDISDAFLVIDNLTMGQTAPPSITSSNGVVNGASFREPIGPNSWITIFGRLLSGSQRIWGGSDFAGNRLPTVIDDVSASINGRPMYVYFVSPGQLNVLTPPDLVDGPAVIEVSRGVLKSQPVTAQVGRVVPGLFMFGVESRRYVAASRNDGSLVGKPSLYPGATTPARPGEIITLWGTGFGRTDPPVPTGEIVPAPLRLVASPVVTIAGATAEVLFAGLTTPGLYQLNVRVPEAPEGDVPVRVQLEGFVTQDNAFVTIGR